MRVAFIYFSYLCVFWIWLVVVEFVYLEFP